MGDVLVMYCLLCSIKPTLPSVHPHQTELHTLLPKHPILSVQVTLLCKQPILSIEMVTTICAGKCWLLLVTNGQWVYCVCVCACVRACVRACACVRVCVQYCSSITLMAFLVVYSSSTFSVFSQSSKACNTLPHVLAYSM